MTNSIDSGFVKLQRKILDWEWYNDIPTKTLFIHLLLKANFKDKKWKGHDIKRGQVLTGRKILSDETGLSEQQTKTALKKLQATNEITSQATNRFSIITLVNYNLYQDRKTNSNQPDNQPEEQQTTSNQPADDPTSNQQATTTKNDKKEEELKNDKKNKELPDFINPEIFKDFKNMRKKMKKEMTERAEKMVIKKLKEFEELKSGNANIALEQSILKNYTDVYEPKTNTTKNTGIDFNKLN